MADWLREAAASITLTVYVQPAAKKTEVAGEHGDALKIRLGVKPKEVVVLEPGDLPRATHKAKRLIDLRRIEQ